MIDYIADELGRAGSHDHITIESAEHDGDRTITVQTVQYGRRMTVSVILDAEGGIHDVRGDDGDVCAIVSELTQRAITTWHPEPVQRLLRKRAQGWEG